MRTRPEPDREAKRAERNRQGWQKRRALTVRRLKNDGSTKEQRELRVQRSATPWVPA